MVFLVTVSILIVMKITTRKMEMAELHKMMKVEMMMAEVAGELQETIDLLEMIEEMTEVIAVIVVIVVIEVTDVIEGMIGIIEIVIEEVEEVEEVTGITEMMKKNKIIQDYSWEDLPVMKLKIKQESHLVNSEKS